MILPSATPACESCFPHPHTLQLPPPGGLPTGAPPVGTLPMLPQLWCLYISNLVVSHLVIFGQKL